MAKDTRSARSTAKSGAEGTSSKPGKALKPLTSFLAGRGAASSSSAGTSASASKPAHEKPAVKKAKPNGSTSAAATKASDAIELSSDDEIEDLPNGSETEDSDDADIVVTGQSGPSQSTSKPALKGKAAPASASKKAVSANKQSITKAKSASAAKVEMDMSPPMSEKAKGKQRAVQETVELEIADQGEDALWSDKYAPVDLAGLSVHPKKVADVRGWIEAAYAGGAVSKYRRIMVLSGPAGSAKTATIRVLCKEMGIELVEYKTSDGGGDLMSNQLPAFLNRATLASTLSFGTLTKTDQIAVATPSVQKPERATSAKDASAFQSFRPVRKEGKDSKPAKPDLKPSRPASRRMLLVEDLPNIFTSTATRSSFRSALMAYSSTKRLNASLEPNANVPLVVIVSEALTRPGQNEGELAASRYQGSGEQSVSVRTVVPVEVIHAPSTAEFKFNPVANTFMKKALNAVLDREFENDSRGRPSAQALDLVIQASDGDIRSALNTLQFLTGKSAEERAAALENAGTKKGKKRKSNGKVKEGELDESASKALAHLVASKEGSLFLFHALGKVLWNKRWGENPTEDAKSTVPKPAKPPKLPSHLSKWNRRASKVDASALFADAPVDSDMFMSYLHQNYPPFCDTAENLDDLLSYLSDADALMRMEGDAFTRHALTSHYSFQVAVRGALVSLPSPPKRRGQKMYKSEVWEAQRKQRDNMHSISDWTAAMTKANLSFADTHDAEDESSDLAALPELLPSKLYLHLELLPYLGLIQSPQRSFGSAQPAPGLFNKAKKAPNGTGSGSSAMSQAMKLNKNLLDIAFMPPAKTDTLPTALGEKEDLDASEGSDDEMKRKPLAPAVKVESSEDIAQKDEQEDEEEADKLYLSDDDIEDF